MAIELSGIRFGEGAPLALIAGPCVIESEEHVHKMARAIGEISGPFIFKASFDKANRTSISSYRGPGLKEGLRILAGVRAAGFPVLTDIHEPSQAQSAAQAVDILQIPAFLCRQTDLLIEAGRTGRIVNIKKGQFVSPRDILHAAEKVASTGNSRILLTERGSSFGYNNLIVDMRGLTIMRDSGWPVIFDATHSVQSPEWRGARGRAENLSSSGPWRAPPQRSEWTDSLSKYTTTRRGRFPMARTPCGWTGSHLYSEVCGQSTHW